MTDKLNEWDRDTVDTTLKAWRQRTRDDLKQTAGGYFNRGGEARGRLGVRIMADSLLQAWLTYKGATNVAPTRESVYQFLKKYHGNVIDDKTLQTITGYVPVPEPQQADPNVAQSPAPKPYTKRVGAILQGWVDHIKQLLGL